jgi:hypothetical protein
MPVPLPEKALILSPLSHEISRFFPKQRPAIDKFPQKVRFSYFLREFIFSCSNFRLFQFITNLALIPFAKIAGLSTVVRKPHSLIPAASSIRP